MTFIDTSDGLYVAAPTLWLLGLALVVISLATSLAILAVRDHDTLHGLRRWRVVDTACAVLFFAGVACELAARPSWWLLAALAYSWWVAVKGLRSLGGWARLRKRQADLRDRVARDPNTWIDQSERALLRVAL